MTRAPTLPSPSLRPSERLAFATRAPWFTTMLGVAAWSLAACSGGSSGAVGDGGFDCGDPDAAVLCLESCNLGCSTTGCAQSDIAQNQIVILTFSEPLDPISVNSSTIRFRTPTGDEPVGEYFVNGRIVEYVPNLSVQAGQTFFGFTNGETYTMSIRGEGESADVVRGSSGRPFGNTLTCTLQSSKGIVDLNQVPPAARLVSPSGQQLDATPLDAQIVLEFNELVDATPFVSGTQSPVTFSVRRTREDGKGGFECNPQSLPEVLSGTQNLSYDAARGVSVLTFVPSQPLVGNVCVEIGVTDGVSDLSGRPAEPQVFSFRTVRVELEPDEIVEDFDDALQFDDEASAGVWAETAGELRFAAIGGDGRHGDFELGLADATQEVIDGRDVYELDCDDTTVPATNTTTGGAIAITDGRFWFSRFVVPADVHLRIVGSTPPIVTVAGRIDVQGVVDVSGRSNRTLHLWSEATGQSGAAGGPFGGAGGQGGDQCQGDGPGSGEFDGRDGGSCRVLAGHAYAGAVGGTGGSGSSLHPASGLDDDQQFGVDPVPSVGLFYGLSATAGGGGGGFYTAGGEGRVTGVFSGSTPLPNQGAFMGPPAPGGATFSLFPFPAGGGLQRSSLHFLVGGSGGGGAGSNATLSLSLQRRWASGAGGGGGGGAIALRAGRSLRVAQNGAVLAVGGDAYDHLGLGSGAQVAPAGGGSGGSIVLQSGRAAELDGRLDVRGGDGGDFDRTSFGGGIGPNGGRVTIRGGDGGAGFVRCELPTAPAPAALAGMQPPAGVDNVGTLLERDDLVSVRSRFYSTRLVLAPFLTHYVIEAEVDGVARTFSDDPALGDGEAGIGSGLRVLFQAASLDVVTDEVLSVGPWRTSVRSSPTQDGISADAKNGFRFLLVADRQVAQEVVVRRVSVGYLK